MRTVTSLLASAVASMLLVSPVFSADTAQATATKAIDDVITTLAAPEDVAKKLEGFTVKLDAVGCYNINGPDGLSLKLCQDDKEARIPRASATDAGTYSWVKGSITNTGTTDVCGIAFASKETDLVKEVKDAIPANLPVTTVDTPPTETFDLAAGTLPVEYAFLLPLDLPTNTPSFVGLADTVKSCTKALKPFVPKLVEVTDTTVDAAAVTADQAVADTTDAVNDAADQTVDAVNTLKDLMTKGTTPPATDGTPTTPTETTPTETTTTEKAEETPVTPPVAPVNPFAPKTPVAPVDKPVEEEVKTTSPAGILSHSLLFGVIAAASVMALFA